MDSHAAAFTAVRPLLFSIAYRMVGSVADAEDLVQEAFVRWQEAPDVEIRSPRAYMATIVTRLAINHLHSARVRIVDKSEANCRQIGTRARKHMGAPQQRFAAAPAEAARLAIAFTAAAQAGNIDELLALLADDLTLWADGGGKARGAALRPIHGPSAVARFVVGVMSRFVPEDSVTRATEINGQPGLIVYTAGRALAAIVLDIRSDRVHTIYAIGNPD